MELTTIGRCTLKMGHNILLPLYVQHHYFSHNVGGFFVGNKVLLYAASML
jgi:hypothetical protein